MSKMTDTNDALSSIPNYFDDIELMPTNIFALDFILKGGIETGSSYQLVGESGIGKSTISLMIAKNICRQGKRIVYIDSEAAITKELIRLMELQEYIDNKQFIYIRESTFTAVEQTLDKLIATDEISLVIVDSIATLVNQGFTNLKNGISITNNNTNNTTRPLVLFMNKYKSLASSKNFALILVNQYRNKIDMQKGTLLKEYGSKNVRYNSDVILRINPIKSIGKHSAFKDMTKADDNGIDLVFEVVKSNKASPLESIPFYLIYGRGISNIYNYFYALLNTNVICREGSYYKFLCGENSIKEQGMKRFYNRLIQSNIDYNDYIDKITEYYQKC